MKKQVGNLSGTHVYSLLIARVYEAQDIKHISTSVHFLKKIGTFIHY